MRPIGGRCDEDGRPWEIIVVDDGSRDGTWGALEAIRDDEPRLRAVRFKRNFGQHPAMHAGIVRSRGDVIVTMDADLQHSAADIVRLVHAVDAGSDTSDPNTTAAATKARCESEATTGNMTNS